MARLSSVLIPSCEEAVLLQPTSSSASAIQTIGKNRIFAINADQDITIRFMNAAGPSLTADSADYRIPANQQTTLDTGQAFDSFEVYNLSASTTANVYYQTLSVV